MLQRINTNYKTRVSQTVSFSSRITGKSETEQKVKKPNLHCHGHLVIRVPLDWAWLYRPIMEATRKTEALKSQLQVTLE